MFTREASAITAALKNAPIVLHHIGSTAVPGILAKPIIDLLGVVDAIADIDANAHALEALGYEAKGAYGIEGRRYFRKNDSAGERRFHLHVFARDTAHVERHLAFRDYLLAHADVAAEYSALKAALTVTRDLSQDDYIAGKDPFIKATERKALEWHRRE